MHKSYERSASNSLNQDYTVHIRFLQMHSCVFSTCRIHAMFSCPSMHISVIACVVRLLFAIVQCTCILAQPMYVEAHTTEQLRLDAGPNLASTTISLPVLCHSRHALRYQLSWHSITVHPMTCLATLKHRFHKASCASIVYQISLWR